jgi:hypothetical protein
LFRSLVSALTSFSNGYKLLNYSMA